MSERPFLLLGTHALQTLTERLQDALRTWSGTWSTTGLDDIGVQVASAAPSSTVHTFEHVTDGNGGIWIAATEMRSASVARAVLGEDWAPSATQPGNWAADILARALTALTQSIAQALLFSDIGPSTTADTPDPALYRPGSGAIMATCSSLGLQIHASAHALRHVPPREHAHRTGGLHPLSASLAQRKVFLTASAGSAEITVDQLMSLQPGDVLRLPTTWTEPVTLLSAGGERLAACRLGQHDGQRAIRLLAPSTPPEVPSK